MYDNGHHSPHHHPQICQYIVCSKSSVRPKKYCPNTTYKFTKIAYHHVSMLVSRNIIVILKFSETLSFTSYFSGRSAIAKARNPNHTAVLTTFYQFFCVLPCALPSFRFISIKHRQILLQTGAWNPHRNQCHNDLKHAEGRITFSRLCLGHSGFSNIIYSFGPIELYSC